MLDTDPYQNTCFNPVALWKAKIVYNFGLSECNKVKSNAEFGLISGGNTADLYKSAHVRQPLMG